MKLVTWFIKFVGLIQFFAVIVGILHLGDDGIFPLDQMMFAIVGVLAVIISIAGSMLLLKKSAIDSLSRWIIYLNFLGALGVIGYFGFFAIFNSLKSL